MLDKCLRGNKIAPLQHAYLALVSTCANGVQFYNPSHTYAAIPYCTIFPFLLHCTGNFSADPAIADLWTANEPSESSSQYPSGININHKKLLVRHNF